MVDRRPIERWWTQLASHSDEEVSAALAGLTAAHQVPATAEQAEAVLAAAERLADSRTDAATQAAGLLARWARLRTAQTLPAEAAVLRRAVAWCMRELAPERGLSQSLGVAAVLLLGALCGKAEPVRKQELAGALVSALQRADGPVPLPTARDVGAGTLALVAALLPGAPVDASHLLAALLHYLSPIACAPASLDALAPMYSGLRSVALGALGSGAAAGAAASLSPAYAVLRGAARPTSPLAQRAAAALALGGLAEGLLRSAAGFAEAQLLATEAEAALLAVCEVADAEAPPQAAASPPPLPAAAAAVDGSSSSSFLVDACALATVQLAEGARRPAPTPAMRRCHARALLHGALSLQPFCGAAAAGQPPAAASKALRLQLDSALGQHVAGLARGLADGYPAASPAEQAWLLGQLVSTAQQTGDLYAAYSLNTPAEWMQAVDAAVLRQLLDRTFLCALALLDAAWRATARNAALRPGCGLDGGEPPHMAAATTAAGIAGVLADLQFCRLRSETYSALLRGVLSALPGAPAGVAALAAHLPCYADLAAAVPARGGAPCWAIDGVAAAKVQFLFTLLGPCAGHLPEEAVAGRVAPLMFLYLLHPHRPASAAAHQLFCALVTAAPPAQRERLAPYYVMRCLEGFPGATPVAQLAAGLAAAVQALLPGSLVPLVCLERVLVRCRELVVGSDPGRQSAATELCGAAAQALLAVPHALLDGAVALFDDALGGLPPEAQLALAPALYAAISHSDDCVRKPELAAWYQARVAAAGAAAARQRKAQLVDTTGAALV